ncbi:PspC domain-containing protein [Saxibacter everestensis]|uniref:PspC domain-containing protein n=1 Tax=Saxibacter everestensis TaxID=2909229 RepID=A0ABY8QW30_9MICO|nr:PspC domain-containing protein [Brevibacteriaceae bacterium ZFBP1038]
MTELVRPRQGRLIGGVCLGIANRFNMRPTIVRLIFVLSCLIPGPQFLIYLALWGLVPSDKPRKR